MGDMKCPKCGGRLVYWGATGALLKCEQCKFGWGNEELWQVLIDTKKKLDYAITMLERIAVSPETMLEPEKIIPQLAAQAIEQINKKD